MDPGAPATHRTQYFEMLGSRGIYHDGWKAVAFHPFVDLYNEGRDPDLSFEDDIWELYHVEEDPSEVRDLARAERARLGELIDLWWQEAEKYQVLPLNNRLLDALMDPRRDPPAYENQVMWPYGAIVPENRVVNVRGRPHRVRAEVVIPPGGASGVLLAMGTVLGGWSFQIWEDRLRYVHSFVGAQLDVITSPDRVAPGRRRLEFEFTPAGHGGTCRLLVDGYPVAEGQIERTPIARYSLTGGGCTCGWEQGPAIGNDYQAPFRFSGQLDRVVISVEGLSKRDPQAEFEAIMAEQ
jgi:arylsulfatase